MVASGLAILGDMVRPTESMVCVKLNQLFKIRILLLKDAGVFRTSVHDIILNSLYIFDVLTFLQASFPIL